ncbi:MAG: MaoC family dehydratase N-terminal domain-containing protein [Clostridiales Family XIII bacterium]|jgi:hypothetical protein|nr:MaoC family dehydratase N-terminal domain-containing protein [Clostridiales Family XIII bacterium]
MSGKYQLFNPGEYRDWEKEEVEFRQAVFRGDVKLGPPPGAGDGDDWGWFQKPHPYTDEEILAYNKLWNPRDPLYTNPAYAKEHGHKSVPAYPGFAAMAPIMTIPPFTKTIASKFYYTNDGTEIEYTRNIYEGDFLHDENEIAIFEDRTKPGTDLRTWFMGGEKDCVDENGKLVYHIGGNVRECYRKIIDGSQETTFSENMASWTAYFPPGHVTTDEDFDRMKEIWDAELIRGDDTPFWEDVPVGFELPKTCTDGPVTYMHLMYYHNIGNMSIPKREYLMDPAVRAVTFRDRFGSYLDETSIHYGGRNIVGARAVWYNDTGARLIARTLTNFVGNKGRVSKFSWRFFPFYTELRQGPLCADMFNKVPGMEGRDCDRHGSDGDTCIGRAVITDKYVNTAGEHCLEVMLWGEDMEGNIVQGCPSEIVLPSKSE